jgi:putative addiction module component (TIGR02574 family)
VSEYRAIKRQGRFSNAQICNRSPLPIDFARVVSYARRMELLTDEELVRLTPPERLALISQLWDSLEDGQLPLTAAQREELDRRLATLDEDRREGITWATLRAELEQRCP